VFPGVWPRFGFLFGSLVQMMFDEIENITNKGRTSSSPVHGGIIDEHQPKGWWNSFCIITDQIPVLYLTPFRFAD
jgi:hypothetical protein